MAFIVDTYNKYNSWDREHARYVFDMNGVQYAVKEVILFWGVPQFPTNTIEDKNPETYHLYDTYEDAIAFVKNIKKLNY